MLYILHALYYTAMTIKLICLRVKIKFLFCSVLLMRQNEYLWSKGLRLQEQGLSDKKLNPAYIIHAVILQ